MTILQKRPEVGAPGPWSFPKADSFTLDNGLTVLVYRRPGQLVVSAGLSLDIPLTAEERGLEGVAGLAAACLDQGSLQHPRTSFADAVESAGAILEASVDYSSTGLYLDVPASHLAEALPLLAEAVSAPELDDSDVDRERTLRLARIEQQQANSAARADHALRAAILDQDCRSSRRKGGERETVAGVKGADVRSFHARYFGPSRAALVLVGEFDETPEDLVSRAFASWQNPAQARVAHEESRPGGRHLYLVDRPGAVQADVRVARFTLDRSDPRWPDFQLAQYTLGGAFLSRLNKVLREERGYTYGIHLATHPLRRGGYTAAQGSFRNEIVAEAVALIPQLLDVRSAPITDEEIVRARTYLAGVQPLQYATAAGVCNGVMTLLAAGLDSGFVDAVRAAYDRVTPESATQAAAEMLPTDDLSLVVVGDAGELAGPLERRGFDVEVIPAESQP